MTDINRSLKRKAGGILCGTGSEAVLGKFCPRARCWWSESQYQSFKALPVSANSSRTSRVRIEPFLG